MANASGSLLVDIKYLTLLFAGTDVVSTHCCQPTHLPHQSVYQLLTVSTIVLFLIPMKTVAKIWVVMGYLVISQDQVLWKLRVLLLVGQYLTLVIVALLSSWVLQPADVDHGSSVIKPPGLDFVSRKQLR